MTLALIVCAVAAISLFFLYRWMTAGEVGPGWIKDYAYAHRGLHGEDCPENTLPAFLKAVEYGYGIELDVRLSKDGQVVVIHDAGTGRVAGVKRLVCDCTADELANMRLLGSEYTIPTLNEVLSGVAGRTPLLIEIKNEGAAGELEEKTYELMSAYEGRYAVQSFSPLSMSWFRKNAPHVERGQLSCPFITGAEHIPKAQRFFVKNLLTNFLCRPNFISYEIIGLEKPLLRRMRRHGVSVLAWVVTDMKRERSVRRLADSIIFEGY